MVTYIPTIFCDMCGEEIVGPISWNQDQAICTHCFDVLTEARRKGMRVGICNGDKARPPSA